MISILFLICFIFDPFDYLQNQKDISIDTIVMPGVSRSFVEFKFDTTSNERFSISKNGKLTNSMNSLILKTCTTKVSFDALEGDYEPERIRYKLYVIRDSVLFNLTWADTIGTYEYASNNLLLLKQLLLCPTKECANYYLDCLRGLKIKTNKDP